MKPVAKSKSSENTGDTFRKSLSILHLAQNFYRAPKQTTEQEVDILGKNYRNFHLEGKKSLGMIA